eukprot:213480-Chlamydomonas_euryale.AAC.2
MEAPKREGGTKEGGRHQSGAEVPKWGRGAKEEGTKSGGTVAARREGGIQEGRMEDGGRMSDGVGRQTGIQLALKLHRLRPFLT